MSKNETSFNGKRREDWETPQWLFDKLNSVFNFYIDLAASEENAKCSRFITTEDDFLTIDTKGLISSHDWAWCNPPYSRNGCGRWVEKIFQVPNSVSLLPASVGAKWFSEVWKRSRAICFIDQRIRFAGAPGVAQFDSCLAVKTDGAIEEGALKILRSLGNVASTTGISPRVREQRVLYL